MGQLEKVEGAAYSLGAAALFGASAPAAKLLLNDLRPILLSALLYLGAAAALFGYRAIGRKSREAVVSRRDLPLIVGIIGFGGMLGPILMLLGLQRLSAVNTSLLLNLEAPFTMLIAVSVMREHLGLREVFAAAVILLGGGLVGFPHGELHGDLSGTMEVAAACLCWGIDNNLTQRISLRDPAAIARIKTLASGVGVAAIASLMGNEIPGLKILIAAFAIGALCYGVSIVLDVKALRVLGAAREAAYFATAPFVGALLSVAVFREMPEWPEIAGAALMVVGVVVLLREWHSHLHTHDIMFHEHLHLHDEHHQHEHDSLAAEPHSHPHMHSPSTHDHPHVSDVHHRHKHRSP